MEDPKTYERLGRRLKALRMAAGYSQQAVASRLGVTFQQVQKYESGTNRLPLGMLVILRDLYNISYDEFFGAPSKSLSEFTAYDAFTRRICLRLAAVSDPEMKRKIGKIIAVLTS